MAIHFTKEYIDELLSRVDTMEVMERHGIRVKAGTDKNNFYIADFCCGKRDFDNGRIKKKTQTYRCMSCGTGGNAIHFLKDVVGMSFHDSVVELSHMVGMELPEESGPEHEKKKRKGYALQLAAEFYEKQNNYEYFLSRGISIDVLKKHRAGYAPGGRVLRNYLESKGFSKEELNELKLINKKGLDKFYGRAVIPIVMFGKVVDLYGRAVDEKNGVKHLYLYGDVTFLGGYDNIVPGQMVSIYESFIDQLVAESNGINNCTNPGGTNKFTVDHGKLLRKKGIEKALVIYDGDSAGRDGMLSVGKILQSEGIDTWIGELPDGTDPAELLYTEGLDGFKNSIDGKPFRLYELKYILKDYSLGELESYISERKANERTASMKQGA
ncbi:CHC2 zinc finger domain-containing protein [Paenibacillus alvei]|uniref:CHC2 zinc finger domain-containing protein n=1 Tax=Paenibacillus alvei TaxID=44250 RepID=UPI00227FBF92|nr:toprim domain-containing protein [Paenibacillus alvei]MCY9540492.1 CHC2 zinc finger domain-containing protein [Paenibacillus alvei]MCY9708304.1 CHC2 zinc finger domain-containing protein [Paenibacillus alvei]MCY9733008.1 CHC2 zinc finger domain-containing protein [Paenibacillus alvei]MCY9755225.1 CHC2 zinc finger domain-containing protein [Paenibacillus alvei]MEC0080297.1 CHC2 zinc finger domain-containing protein [Paenibacillus alvei]